MKTKSFKFSDEDMSILASIKSITGIGNDTDAVKFALRKVQNAGPSFLLGGSVSLASAKIGAEASPIYRVEARTTPSMESSIVNKPGWANDLLKPEAVESPPASKGTDGLDSIVPKGYKPVPRGVPYDEKGEYEEKTINLE